MENVPKYEQLGRLIYGFHRWVNPARLRDPQALPPGFAQRGAALAGRFDSALARYQEQEGAVPEQEIDALLADAAAFSRAMRAANGE